MGDRTVGDWAMKISTETKCLIELSEEEANQLYDEILALVLHDPSFKILRTLKEAMRSAKHQRHPYP